MSGETSAETKRDLRAEILAAATELFASQGFDATSIREVVQACGCTKPALYYYFQNKELLFLEALRAQVAAMDVMIVETLAAGGPLRERLKSGLKRFFQYVTENPSSMRLLWRIDMDMQSQPDDVAREFAGTRERHMAFISEFFQQGISRGELRGDVDPTDCAIALAGIMDIQIQLGMQGVPREPERVDATFDLLFDGIAKR